jgi:hypothetical protein
MADRGGPDPVPEPFRRAVEALRSTRLRPEVLVEESPAPQRLAPFAVALTGDVEDGDHELATGRFVLLHDPAGHDTWQGTFRVVTFVRAELELELAVDPMLPSVGWAWLEEAMESRRLVHTALSGTVTRVTSEAFGTMADREPNAEIEIRASWTALDPGLGPHLEAWADVLCTAAGLPPVAPGVLTMPRPRDRRAR